MSYRPPNPQRTKRMIEMYARGYSQEDIAAAFGVTRETVSYHFRQNHVPIRHSGDYRRGKTAVQYRREMIARQMEIAS